MTGRIADKTTGTYRDGLKHGEWIKISNGKIIARTSFCFGIAIVIHKYTRDGKLERIMHYDYDGRPIKGEYLDSKMIIHYRRGIIEDM
ncbi:hypothetical protein D5b_00065 [Faustovirus]|nr:hypothetical protein D5b_00065 [Faustovirus]AMN84845.1 hypothetical protein D6_00445 [Faustovirus]AMP44023.1 hypothetical protein PRJ_Dakar_00064 [Faustovirus]